MRAVLIAAALLLALPGVAAGAVVRDRSPSRLFAHVTFREAARSDTSPTLRALARIAPRQRATPRPVRSRSLFRTGEPVSRAPVRSIRAPATMPAPSVSFAGFAQSSGPIPPDTEGDVGPKHYVQYTNGALLVFDKTGKRLLGPLPGNAPWAGFGGPCEQTNDGDPIVLYDQLADRWLLSQFSQPSFPSGPFYQCIAISQTPDPTGSYYRYAFKVSDTKFNDYSKLGVWPDGYYMSTNQFTGPDASTYAGAALVAFDRAKMLQGDPAAGMVYVDTEPINPNFGGMLPADLDGLRLPPQGAGEPFVEVDDDAFGFPADEISLFRFHVDWANPSASSVEGPIELPTQPLDFDLCGASLCVPQPGTDVVLDSLAAQVMHRVTYRNTGGHESLLFNVTVDADGNDRAGIRWFELRGVSTTPKIYQEGTYAPGTLNRWMGSLAMDGNGNIALGYSVSSASTYPSIRYAGRLAGDPLGQLPQGEATLVDGKGSQIDPSGRWGDYSSMDVDPVDDCTFWYTNEYYAATSARGYSTQIGAFAFPSCDATAPAAKARSARAKTGQTATLRFTVTDNKGEARARIRLLDGSDAVVRTTKLAYGPATGTLRTAAVTAPSSAGAYRWCVTAIDRRGNASDESCAGLSVR